TQGDARELKILKMDLRRGVVSVLLETNEDLWTLYNLLEKGDLAFAKTSRDIKSEGIGRPSSFRRQVSLWIRVERVYLDRSTNRLRVHGIVHEAPEDLGIKGSHHTLSLSLGDRVSIAKMDWKRHHLERLERARSKVEPLTIAAIDLEECAIGTIRPYGVEIKAEIRSNLPGKLEHSKREQAIRSYFSDIAEGLESATSGTEGKFAIVGPGLAKESFLNYLRSARPKLLERLMAVGQASSGGIAGVHEALRSGALREAMREARIMEEIDAVNEVLRRLSASSGDVSYGPDEVEEDAKVGAVEALLVCGGLLREADEELRARLEAIIRAVEDKGGRVLIVSEEHEGGKALSSLGGLAALLRFRRH
ncbi:MAG: mRNA surveillance protein pelota, partial [Candidatus Bathyarchaeia archaeon]